MPEPFESFPYLQSEMLIIREITETDLNALNEKYCQRGIGTEATRLMVNYLCNDVGVKTLKAYVMPENIYLYSLLNSGLYRSQLLKII